MSYQTTHGLVVPDGATTGPQHATLLQQLADQLDQLIFPAALTALTLLNDWAAIGGRAPKTYVHAGRCYLQGAVVRSGGITQSTLCTLPAGPQSTEVFPVAADYSVSGSIVAGARVAITAAGDVIVSAPSQIDSFALSPVNFRLAT